MKEMPISWPQQNGGVFGRKSDAAAAADVEPFSKAPAPSSVLSGFSFAPDPLLAVTPEKTLLKNCDPISEDGEGKPRARQRVRFAPDTRTSPPSKGDTTGKKSLVSKGTALDDCKLGGGGGGGDDDESMPRSFPPSCHKVYRPERYCDDDGEATDSKTVVPPPSASRLSGSSSLSSSSSSSSAPKAYTVGTQGSKTYYVPLDRSTATITSDYSGLHKEKPLTATIVRHKAPSNDSNNSTVVLRHEKPSNRNDNKVSSRELKEAFESALEEELKEEAFFLQEGLPPSSSQSPPPRRRSRSRSTSPASQSQSQRQARKVSPLKNRHHHRHGGHHRSPSRSPSRHSRTPSPGQVMDVEALTPGDLDEGSEAVVRVIREATYQPVHDDYIFPFADRGNQAYDSSVENQLARPEFNSALKVSQELKSVREKRPDTWAATSHKLKTCERKRTEIQEKASSRVNLGQGSGLFSGLVGVDLPLDDVCHSLETQITLRAPSPKPAAVKVPVGKEPDIMEFFTPDLQQELPDLTLTGLQPITASLSSADPIIAFDLYRHNRVWNGLSDS